MKREDAPKLAPGGGFALSVIAGGLILMAFVAGLATTMFGGDTDALQGSQAARQGGFAARASASASAIIAPARSWGSSLLGGREPEAADMAQAVGEMPSWKAAERVASFSCDGRLTAARQLICRDWELATADYNLGILYRNVMQSSKRPDRVRAAQERWASELDRLSDDPKQIAAHYQSRIDALAGE